jgi:hypothetical protein
MEPQILSLRPTYLLLNTRRLVLSPHAVPPAPQSSNAKIAFPQDSRFPR